MPMITLKKINKYYDMGDEKLHALIDIDLEIQEGEMVAIMGPSGSGKSTLIRILGFMDQQYEGDYLFEDQNIRESDDETLSYIRNQKVGFVFQNFQLIDTDTIFENIQLPLLYGGASYGETKETVMNLIEKVGLAGKEKKLPKQLSGGQQQRCAIARSVVNRPKFLIADEPTGALDSHTSREILELFKQLNEEGMTILLVTHDEEVGKQCKRMIRILDGKIESDTTEEVNIKTDKAAEKMKLGEMEAGESSAEETESEKTIEAFSMRQEGEAT